MFKQIYRRELNLRIIDESLTHISGKALCSISTEKCWQKGLRPAFPIDDEDEHDEQDSYSFTEEDLREAERPFECLCADEELL